MELFHHTYYGILIVCVCSNGEHTFSHLINGDLSMKVRLNSALCERGCCFCELFGAPALPISSYRISMSCARTSTISPPRSRVTVLRLISVYLAMSL